LERHDHGADGVRDRRGERRGPPRQRRFPRKNVQGARGQHHADQDGDGHAHDHFNELTDGDTYQHCHKYADLHADRINDGDQYPNAHSDRHADSNAHAYFYVDTDPNARAQ
jgi:hypothetical protein